MYHISKITVGLLDKILLEQRNIYRKHLSDFTSYSREYIINLRNIIDQRNSIGNEYYKNRSALDDKKNKMLAMDKSQWEIDINLCKLYNLDPETVKNDVEIAHKFIMKDVM